jgi:tetratricopeptide (TPR) repeat protein
VRVLDFIRSAPNRRGRRPDATTDRVDLCATMFRTLFGVDPFGPDGQVRTPPLETKVPLAIRRTLQAGLRTEDTELSMHALAGRLRRAIRTRRVVWGAALAGIVLTTAVTAFASAPAALPERSWCQAVDARIEAVWNPEIAQRVHAAFVATRQPYAEEAWTSVERDVERFVERWRAAEREDCARAGRDANPAATYCLHRQYESLRAFTGALVEADADLLTNAARTAAALGNPSVCDEQIARALPHGAADLDEALAIQAILSAADIHRELSRYDDALASAKDARARAQAVTARALVAEADVLAAQVHAALGDEDMAERGFHEAFSAAVATNHTEVIARSSLGLAHLFAEQGRHDEARRWAAHARGAVETVDDDALRIRLASVEGACAFRRGDYAQARDDYQRAVDLAEAVDPPDHFTRLHATKMLANSLGSLGDTQAEIDLLEGSLEETEDRLGGGHPQMGNLLNSLASALSRRGSIDLALQSNERAVEVFDGVFGSGHANSIMALTNLATTLHEAGRDEEAEAAYTRALRTAEAEFDPNDTRRVTIAANVGMFYATTERYVEAAALLSDAAARSEAINGPDHSFTLGYLNNLAATYMFSGNEDKAYDVYVELLGRTERVLGEDHPQVVPCLLGIATVETARGDAKAAVPRLQRALEIAVDRGERPERIASVQWHLAQALWDSGIDRASALKTARAAEQSYLAAVDGGFDVGEAAQEVRAWVQARQ